MASYEKFGTLSAVSEGHAPYFFIEPSAASTGSLTLEGADATHLARVRRAGPGDRVTLCDGRGAVFESRVRSVTPSSVELEIVSHNEVPRPSPQITMFQALAKPAKLELTIQKLVEIGVDEIMIFSSERSVPRWDESKSAANLRRWLQIGREAAKQSHRAWEPAIQWVQDVEGATSEVANLSPVFLADPGAGTSLRSRLPLTADDLGAVVGPEGGFDSEELRKFEAAGAIRVALGKQILRTETAGLALASILMFHFGRLG